MYLELIAVKWRHMVTYIWVIIGLPDGTKPLPEPMLTNRQWICGIQLRTISLVKIFILNMSL